MPEPTTTPADEIRTMSRINALLDKLDPDARRRVVDWIWDRYSKDTE